MEKAQAVKGRSLLADARRRLFRNKAAVASMALLALIALLAVFAPLTSPYAFTDQDYNADLLRAAVVAGRNDAAAARAARTGSAPTRSGAISSCARSMARACR